MATFPVSLVRTGSTLAGAVLRTDLDRAALLDAEAAWGPARVSLARRAFASGKPHLEHDYWNWGRKASLLGEPGVSCLGSSATGTCRG